MVGRLDLATEQIKHLGILHLNNIGLMKISLSGKVLDIQGFRPI